MTSWQSLVSTETPPIAQLRTKDQQKARISDKGADTWNAECNTEDFEYKMCIVCQNPFLFRPQKCLDKTFSYVPKKWWGIIDGQKAEHFKKTLFLSWLSISQNLIHGRQKHVIHKMFWLRWFRVPAVYLQSDGAGCVWRGQILHLRSTWSRRRNADLVGRELLGSFAHCQEAADRDRVVTWYASGHRHTVLIFQHKQNVHDSLWWQHFTKRFSEHVFTVVKVYMLCKLYVHNIMFICSVHYASVCKPQHDTHEESFFVSVRWLQDVGEHKSTGGSSCRDRS